MHDNYKELRNTMLGVTNKHCVLIGAERVHGKCAPKVTVNV